MDEKIVKLQELIDQHDNIVFFGGAGVSTESGIPDFRSADGIYHQSYKYSPEQVVSHSFFIQHTEFTSIPRAVHRHAQKQAVCLTGRTNGPNLKNHFFHYFFSFVNRTLLTSLL